MAKVAPTYMIHVFHETDETILDDDGRTKPVLRAQTSFGYFVNHSGPLFGWDAELDADSNVVGVYIGYLRRKIDEPFGVHSIETVRGVGYRLRDEPSAGDRHAFPS